MLRGKVITDGDVARVLLNNITHVCGLMHADVGNRPNVALRVAGVTFLARHRSSSTAAAAVYCFWSLSIRSGLSVESE